MNAELYTENTQYKNKPSEITEKITYVEDFAKIKELELNI